MRWAHFILLILSTVYAKEEESNEITPPRPPANLDANLRRALLKALTELENEENEKFKQESFNIPNLPHLDARDKIIEKASASALSFFTNAEASATKESSTTTTTTTEESTLKPIVIVQRSNGVQHKPIISVENEPFSDGEQILTSASSSFTSSGGKFSYDKTVGQETRSSNSGANTNLFSGDRKIVTKPSRMEATTVTTTTSTEESEAKVEDVQFFSAPLVVAFTVHQDEGGLPKRVEPIYRQTTSAPIPTTTKRDKIAQNQQLSLKQEQNSQQHQTQITTQLALQQKQKSLEEEILRLKQQQQQQNYLIRQQQLLHEQQLQLQRQKLFEEQIRLRNNQQSFVPLTNFNQLNNQQQIQTKNQFNTNNSKVKGSLVSFQPSITFNSNQQQTESLPLNAQQLPVKNAVDFRTPLVPSFSQFSYSSQQQPTPNLVQSLSQQPLPRVNNSPNFNSSPNVQSQNQQPLVNSSPNFNLVQSQGQQQLPRVSSSPNFNSVQNVQSQNQQPLVKSSPSFNSVQNFQSQNQQALVNSSPNFNSVQNFQPQNQQPLVNSSPNLSSVQNFQSQNQQALINSSPNFKSVQNFQSQNQQPLVNSPNFSFTQSVQPQNQQQVSLTSSNFNFGLSNNQPEITLTAPKHNRVFRQESTTGNFLDNGFNSNFNYFNQVPIQQQNNRYFKANAESTPYNFNRIQPPVVNQHLNNLLYNSGIIRGKQQEDLNIVSKVLSLNHFGGDNRFAGSNVNEQRLPSPLTKL